MTLLEMLDVLEAGCITLQQRSSDLEAALSRAPHDVTPATATEEEALIQEEAPKRRAPAKRKSKGAKARRPTAKKKKVAAKAKKTATAGAGTGTEPEVVSGPLKEKDKEDEAKRGKRQALGMSFSALRAAIQSRRGVRRGEEVASDQSS